MTTTTTTETAHADGTPLLTIDEAADYLAITKATLYTWRSRRTGYGPRAVKVGGCLRFKRSDLDDWIAAHTEAVADGDDRVDSNRGKAPHPAAGVALTRRP
jgi:excisionase family DNA binding protein